MKSWTPTVNMQPIAHSADGWASRPDSSPDRNGGLADKANAMLVRGNQMIGLWVNDIGADFEMGGQTAQSKLLRTFFPHNLVAPVFTIGGQTPNSFQYNRLAHFIREAQYLAMRGTESVVRFVMGSGSNRPQSMKFSAIDIDGYVTSTSGGAERWVNAPTYQFQFVITKVRQFPGLNRDISFDPTNQTNQVADLSSIFLSTSNGDVTFYTPSFPKPSAKKDHKQKQREKPAPDKKAPTGTTWTFSGTANLSA